MNNLGAALVILVAVDAGNALEYIAEEARNLRDEAHKHNRARLWIVTTPYPSLPSRRIGDDESD